MSARGSHQIVTGLTLAALLLSSALGAALRVLPPGGQTYTPTGVSHLGDVPVGPVAPETTEIHWWNGQSVPGTLQGANGEFFHWKCDLFTTEMALRTSAIRRVRFAGDSAESEDDFRIVFANGNQLTGNLIALDEKTLTFSSAQFGKIVSQRDQVALVQRIKGSTLIASTPADLLRGTPISKGRFERSAPVLATGGKAAFFELNGALNHEIALPEKSLLELVIRLEEATPFSLTLAADSQWITVENWGDELILRHQDQFASAGTTPITKDGRALIRLGWDQASRRAQLFSAEGKSLAEIVIDDGTPNAEDQLKQIVAGLSFFRPLVEERLLEVATRANLRRNGHPLGLTLTNRGAGFLVEHYQVASWEGTAPPARSTDPTVPTVQLLSEWIEGTPQSLKDGKLAIKTKEGQREIALQDARSLSWTPKEDAAKPEANQTEIWFRDGCLIRGKLLEVVDGKLRIETPLTAEPIAVSLANCRTLSLPLPAKSEEEEKEEGEEAVEPSLPLAQLDKIAAGPIALHGKIHYTGKDLPDFQPQGCDQVLTPVRLDQLTFTSPLATKDRPKVAETLLYTKEEAWPVSEFKLEKDTVTFSSPSSENQEIKAEELQAVHLTLPEAMGHLGFADPAWSYIGSSNEIPKLKDGVLTLAPNRAIAHPFILQGEKLSFGLQRHQNITAVRLTLFCDGAEKTPGSPKFLVAHYGSQVYAGPEGPQPGMFATNKNIRLGQSNALATISLVFSEERVDVRVNEIGVGSIEIPKMKDKPLGTGLIIETTSAWGNRVGPALLSQLKTSAPPTLVGAPPMRAKAKQECLLLPRLRRIPPPKHILIGNNGDLLRGEVSAINSKNISIRVGLNNLKVPRDRVAAFVWVAEPDQPMMRNIKRQSPILEPVAQPDENTSDNTQWLDLKTGGRVKLAVERWTAEGVVGTHRLLGKCTIPTASLHRLSLPALSPQGAIAALTGWKFQNTVDPKPPGLEDADISPMLGEDAPPFKLATLDPDKEISLEDYEGKVLVLDFWSTWCVPCVKSLPELVEAIASFPTDKVAFLGVNEGESHARVQQFLETRSLDFPVVFDPNLQLGRAYQADSLPYTVVIDPGGVITHVEMGAEENTRERIIKAINDALPLEE